MNHPDIISYLCQFLNSKSLAMFSNTNHFIHRISGHIYNQRTDRQHIDTMVHIDKICYSHWYENIILKDNHEGYTKKMSCSLHYI
jgi:hypothetical protein